MTFNLDPLARTRFTSLIQRHRKLQNYGKGWVQKEICERIGWGTDLSAEISRFENGHADVLQRWLAEPMLTKVASAYGFASPSALLDLVESASVERTISVVDPWHPAFPAATRAQMELPRAFSVAHLDDFVAFRNETATEAVSKLADSARCVHVVIDSTSGAATAIGQLTAAWASQHSDIPLPKFRITEHRPKAGQDEAVVYVGDWTKASVGILIAKLREWDHLSAGQAARVAAMIDRCPDESMAGLPISLVIQSIADEARAAADDAVLHKRLVEAEWRSAVARQEHAVFAEDDRGTYCELWAQVAGSSGSATWWDLPRSVAATALGAVLARRGWQAPDARRFAERVLMAGETKAKDKRQSELSEIAIELSRPGPERTLDLLIRMGLLVADADRVRAKSPALAQLAAAWGFAERPELLAAGWGWLALDISGRRMRDVGVFGGDASEVWRRLSAAPDWALTDRDHAFLRYLAATAHPEAVKQVDRQAVWARVLYARAGHGRWTDRIWRGSPAMIDLDIALRTVSERYRERLPILRSVDELRALISPFDQERIEAEGRHVAVSEPADERPNMATLASLAPWQFPVFDNAELDAVRVSEHDYWAFLLPHPRPVEVLAAASLRGLAPATEVLRGDGCAESLFWRMPEIGRLVGVVQGTDKAVLAKMREVVLRMLNQPESADSSKFHDQINLAAEGYPLLERALGLANKPQTTWQAMIAVLRVSGGLPNGMERLQFNRTSDVLYVRLVDEFDDVVKLKRLETALDRHIASSKIYVIQGVVHAFGVRVEFWGRENEDAYRTRQPAPSALLHPYVQLCQGLLKLDEASHAAAVALYRRGEPDALERRAKCESPAMSAATARALLDACRIAELPDAPLDRVKRTMTEDFGAEELKALVENQRFQEYRDQVITDANVLKGLNVGTSKLAALANDYSRLRSCYAGTESWAGTGCIRLPLPDGLSQWCDRLSQRAPGAVSLIGFGAERGLRAMRALVEAGDEAILREWNLGYRREVGAEEDPDQMVELDDPAPRALPSFSIEERRKGGLRQVVAQVLAGDTALRKKAWELADEPDAALRVLEIAVGAGAPYPSWVLAGVRALAAKNQAWHLWNDRPEFRRERLMSCMIGTSGTAGYAICRNWSGISKDGPAEVRQEAFAAVMEWIESTEQPFMTNDSDLWDPKPDGVPWTELQEFLSSASRYPDIDHERVLRVIEGLWDRMLRLPLGHPANPVGVPPAERPVSFRRDLVDDLAKLLIGMGATRRVERAIRDGVVSLVDDDPDQIEHLLARSTSIWRPMGFGPLLPVPRTRSDAVRMRLLTKFAPPEFDYRSLVSVGGTTAVFAWAKLAQVGDDVALDDLSNRLVTVDIGSGRWAQHEELIGQLAVHRPAFVLSWLLSQAAQSSTHEDEARAIALVWMHRWGDRAGEVGAWVRGAAMPTGCSLSPPPA